MRARVLSACAWKETLLLWRDPQTLMLLFAMPTLFILIMSLALQDRFRDSGQTLGQVRIVDRDGGKAAADLIDRLRGADKFSVSYAGHMGQIKERVRRGALEFAIEIRDGFSQAIEGRDQSASKHVRVLVSPDVGPERTALLSGRVRSELAQLQLEQLAQRLRPMARIDPASFRGEVSTRYLYGDRGERGRPSSVQQNVPAWLIFGIFFVVIPLSNTMIRERQSGMEQRLRTMPVGQIAVVSGKLAPYFVVNQIQSLAMFAVGIYVVPAIGGEALDVTRAGLLPLATMAVAVSIAALGYALLVASASKTPEQAGMLGGGGNIILAAIGGIMVPEFVMPPTIQSATVISPMAWALEGFLAALLEQGGWGVVGPRAAALALFGLAGMVVSGWLQSRRTA